jgi:ABC-type branched-subunit amino acid transport system substrate-binding protein
MKKLILPSLAIAVLAIAAVLWYNRQSTTTPATASNSIRVAAVLNLTGPSARFDTIKQTTLGIARERLRKLYPKLELELRTFDAGGSADITKASVRQAQQWGARYYLSGTSPTALAIAADVRGLNPAVVQIANAANPEFGPPRPGEYRFWPDWKQEAQLVLQVLREQKYPKALLIRSSDPYSEALTKELRTQAGQGEPIDFQVLPYDPAGTPDFRPALLRAKAEQVPVVVVFGLPPGITALCNQLRDAEWTGALIGGVNINLALDAYAKAKLTGPFFAIQTEAMQTELRAESEASAFRREYEAAEKGTPPFHALYLADALYFIAEAHRSPSPASTVVERQAAVRNFESASGTISVNADGTLSLIMQARKLH